MSVTCAYTYDQLLRYTEAEDARWCEWLMQHRGARDMGFQPQWGHDVLLSEIEI